MSQVENRAANVILAGVGGQGSVLASRLLAGAAMRDGKDVKVAETFGAATRGGSVMTHIRIGEVWAPMMMEDEADVIVSMEPLEALRVGIQFLKPEGWVLLNTRAWLPVDVAIGRARYPELRAIVEGLERLGGRVVTLDATEMALEAGNTRAANTVMLGGLFALGVVDVREESLFQAMEERWPERLVQLNRVAYDLGYRAVQERKSVVT